jgi:hypothetical protein
MLQWAGPFLVGVQFPHMAYGNELYLKSHSLTPPKKKNQIEDDEM